MRLCSCCFSSGVGDATLIRCIQQRQPCHEMAIEEMLRRYEPLVRAALSWLGLQDNGGYLPYNDAQDAAQGGRIALLEAVTRFDPAKGPFAAFAIKYVRGGAVRALFSSRGLSTRGEGAQIDFYETLDDNVGGTVPSAEDEVIESGWGMGPLAGAIRLLPHADQDLLRALYGQCWSVSEVADRRGVRKQTVSAAAKRALVKVAAQLDLSA